MQGHVLYYVFVQQSVQTYEDCTPLHLDSCAMLYKTHTLSIVLSHTHPHTHTISLIPVRQILRYCYREVGQRARKKIPDVHVAYLFALTNDCF